MLLKTGQCFTNELELNANRVVIAGTFNDCNGDPHTPGTQLAKCSDIPTIPAAPVLQLSGQVLSLSTGGSVTLPDQDTDAQTLTLAGNDLTISGGNTVTLPSAPGQVAQVLSIAGNTVTLSGGGGSVVIPDLDTQDLSISGNVISLTNGGSVTLPAAATQDPYATPAQTVAGAATNLIVNPADLYARENIAAQTGLSNDVTAIPAPTAAQSPWGVNLLGETLHYAPGLGWQIVDNRFGDQIVQPAGLIPTPVSAWATAVSLTMPRAGRVIATAHITVDNSTFQTWAGGLALNGINKSANNAVDIGPITQPYFGGVTTHNTASGNAVVTWTGDVAAGNVLAAQGITVGSTGQMRLANLEYTYIN